ncbi:MAG: ComEC/Rec2 family competence protein [Patescibacteria group bacterium]
MKKAAIYVFIVIISISLVLFSISMFSGLFKQKTGVIFFDVGQGDSALIKLPNNKVILIDGGPDKLVINRLGKELPYFKRVINYLIISHFHDDHVIGFLELIKRYKVKNIIYIEESEKPIIIKDLLNLAKKEGVNLIPLKDTLIIDYSSDCSLKLINPEILEVPDDPNNSIITKFNCRGIKALFTGDNPEKVEKALINKGIDLSSDVFKASHHGSKSANSEDFLRAIGLKLLIISVGVDNRFGHPSFDVLDRAKYLNITIKRTDELGSIRISGGD